MKKGIVFILGIITGVLLALVLAKPFSTTTSPNENNTQDEAATIDTTPKKEMLPVGMTLFDAPGEVVERGSAKVEQVLPDGSAIARCSKYGNESFYGTKILIYKEEGKHYYDEQIVKTPKGKCFRHVGTYKTGYETLPIVKVME